MKLIKSSLLLLLLLSVSACSYVKRPQFMQGRDKEYLTARAVDPLTIPKGLNGKGFTHYYPIPYHYYTDNAKTVSYVPPGIKC